jgi:PAS domain S-box-containing protein
MTAGGSPAGGALDRIARFAARMLDVPAVVVTVGESAGQRIRGRGGSSPPDDDGAVLALCSAVAARGEDVVRPEAGTDTALHGGPAAFAGVPLGGAGGRTLGCIAALDPRPREWSAGEMDALHDLAALAAREVEAEAAGDLDGLAAAALEQFGDPVAITDLAGRFRYANPAHARLLGYPPGRHAEFTADDFLPDGEARACFAEGAGKARAGGGWRGRVSFRTLAGAALPLEVTLGPVRDARGEELLLAMARDAAGEASREGQLRRAERLASLGTLLGGVAHELNNPLAAIKSFAQLLLLDERHPEDQEALEVIEREAARAARIVADLRLVARQTERGGGPRGPVQLNDVVRGVLEIRRYTLQTHGVDVRADLARDLPSVHADPGGLEQVVLNLVLNAEHSLADHPGERRLIVRTRPSALGVSLQVVDSGPGIPGENLERIFDPFWTTREPGQGAGLGLSLVHGIVTEHGGEIRVDSEPGKGAAFAVELPRAPAAPGRAPVHAAALRPLRVLVVDDEAPVRRSIARYLERRGHRVDEASDGREVLARLDEAGGALPDVILADLRMPGLGGDGLLAALRAREDGAEERLVFITGAPLSDAAVAAMAASGIPVVSKPFELEQVARAVEQRAARGTGGVHWSI